jgi:hypothetical protein
MHEGETGQPQAQAGKLEAAACLRPDDDDDTQHQEGEAVNEEDDVHVVAVGRRGWRPRALLNVRLTAHRVETCGHCCGFGRTRAYY